MPGRGSVNERGQGARAMKASSDHIATSHVGSLPRPDGLIAVHRAHEAGEPIDEAAFQQTLRGGGGGGGAPATRYRHRHPRRRRVRQADGPARAVRLVVALFVAASRRARLRRAQPVRHHAATVPPRRGRADQLRRPPGSQPIRRRLRRSRVRHHHRAAARRRRSASRRSPIPATMRSRPTSPISRRRCRRPGSRRVS